MTTTEQNTSARAYVVGCNIAGYLPESSPYAFRDFDDAVMSMRDDLNRDLDSVGEILWDAMVTCRSTYLHYWILCDILTDIELEEMNAS